MARLAWLFAAALLAGCGRDEPIVVGADLAPLPASPAPTQPPPKPAQAAPAPPAPAQPPAAAANAGGESWNAAQIKWLSYADGLARAKAENKPICLVFYTEWCPHCRNYSRVFNDPKIVERAREFVMIRVNPDEQSDIGEKYAPDGGYVPRTFFLAPDGTLMADVRAPRPQFVYFFDEHNPASLLAGMEAALKKRGG
ncbi:thioredoxin family protein [Polyangium aurulentum]|uniref:thioredoxin family protein n=1 Tax=Polyangium aurulentum TaxID=2567896 RepID=UPI0010AE980D|nr:thioredoxin family protein [Polyangium aurulentum]UQA57218.1 thioredoxin family protein [Polyangium aurulentum]